jgi:large subunit ribosomal protein L2
MKTKTKTSDKKLLSKKKPEKSLLVSLKKTGGRGNSGRITVRHKGGGAKRKYRIIEFGEKKFPSEAKVLSLEYDPNRTCYIALIEYSDGERAYILAPQGLKAGDKIVFDEKAPIAPGNRMRLKNIPVGMFVYNVELVPGEGGKIARAAGASCQVFAQEDKYTLLKLPSTEIRKVPSECFASIGELSNPQHRFEKLGKAGRARWKGIRPTVRGSAMSPVAHPHGGGEGKAPIGLKYPKTPWGKPALGVKTRKKKWTDKLIVKRRKKKKKK